MVEIDVRRMAAALSGTVFGDTSKLRHFATIGSTNTYAVEAAQNGAPAGSVYVADEQTSGRGRSDHRWQSTAGDGLYVSVLLRPALRGVDALKISLATGMAAQRAIVAVSGLRIDLRWPNDLVVPMPHGPARKCGGILAETAMDAAGMLQYVVIGVGINLNQMEFAPELRASATSLRLAMEAVIERDAILSALLLEIAQEMMLLEQEVAGERIAENAVLTSRFEWASTWARGKRVKVTEGDDYTGVTAGLDGSGLLQVLLRDGSQRLVRHGGVREDLD